MDERVTDMGLEVSVGGGAVGPVARWSSKLGENIATGGPPKCSLLPVVALCRGIRIGLNPFQPLRDVQFLDPRG